MENYLQSYHNSLESALKELKTAQLLRTLGELAEVYIGQGNKEDAVGLLTFILRHPRTPDVTRMQAKDLFLDLEEELCPRVILDAKVRAQEITVEQLVYELLADASQ